jgi:hypothetical protein
MRNTLRLLGIIALVALIGFGLIACNDGSTTTTTEKIIIPKSPIEDDFIYEGFGERVQSPDVKDVSIKHKDSTYDGVITIFYNGSLTNGQPLGLGTYIITFNASPSTDGKWGYSRNLVAPSLEVIAQPKPDRVDPNPELFKYEGFGEFKKTVPATPRGARITSTYGAMVSRIRYNGSEIIPDDGTVAEYTVTFHVEEGVGYYAADLTAPYKIKIWEGVPVLQQDFLISGLSQVYDANGVRRAVTVTPKVGASQGNQTLWYTGVSPTVYPRNLLPPWEKGSYTVTMDVAEDGNFQAIKDISIGTLVIDAAATGANRRAYRIDDFRWEKFGGDDDWSGAYSWDGEPKGFYIEPANSTIRTGKITFYYNEIMDGGDPNYGDDILDDNGVIKYGKELVDEYPTDAGTYQVSFKVDESVNYSDITTGANNPIGKTDRLALPERLVIRPVDPKKEDFKVKLQDPSLPNIQDLVYVPIGENVVIGTHTYKNINYPVDIMYRGKLANNWLNIFYDGNTVTQPDPNTGLPVDIGPVNANPAGYRVTFTLKPTKNLLTVGSAAVAGRLIIEKATPTLDHYTIVPPSTTGTAFGATPSLGTVTRKPSGGPDGLVISPGRIVDAYTNLPSGTTVPSTTTGVGTYVRSFTVEAPTTAPDSLNWNATPPGVTFNVGTVRIIKAAIPDTGVWSISDTDYHVQSAYNVKGISQFVTVSSANVTRYGNFEVRYLEGNGNTPPTWPPNNGVGNSTTVVPQKEGRYGVKIFFAGNDNFNANSFVIENGFTGEFPSTVSKVFGLVVNPLIIRNMGIFKSWLGYVSPLVNSPGFSTITQYNVVLVLTEFNSDEYNPKSQAPTDECQDTMWDLLKAYSNVPVHLNFNFDETAELFTEFADRTTIREGAFAGLTNIKKVTFLNADTTGIELDTGAFKDCEKLTEVPAGVEIIGDEVFQGTGITSLQLSSSRPITYIGVGAFKDLANFTGITLASGYVPDLGEIGASAFENTKIANLTVYDSIETIGQAAFKGCPLEKVTFEAEEFGVDADENYLIREEAFPGDLVEKYQYTDGTGGTGLYTNVVMGDKIVWSNQDRPNVVVITP